MTFTQLPNSISLPNSVRRWVFVWSLLTAQLIVFGGMTFILAISGEWLWAALLALLLGLCGLQSWMYFSERLNIDASGFEYRLCGRRWRAQWTDCARIAPAGSWWDGRHRILVTWVTEGPDLLFIRGNRMEEKSETHSALGMNPAELARLMNAFRERATGTRV